MAKAESHDTTNPSRRRFLMTAPVAAFAINTVGPFLPDAALFALEPRIKAAEDAYLATLQAWNPADEAMTEWWSRNPRPEAGDEKYNPLTADGLHYRTDIDAFYCDVREWKRCEAEARKACRYDELRAVSDAACERTSAVLRELVALRAESLEGLKFKARFVDMVDDMDTSIISDLLAMGGA